DSSKAGHDVVAVVEQRNVGGPLILRIFVEPLHLGGGGAVKQETQHAVGDDGIVNCSMLFIRLTENHDGRPTLSPEQPFHSCRSYRLMFCHVTAVQIAGRKNLKNAKDHTDGYAYAEEDARVLNKFVVEQVKGPHSCHDEGAGNHGTAHIMG